MLEVFESMWVPVGAPWRHSECFFALEGCFLPFRFFHLTSSSSLSVLWDSISPNISCYYCLLFIQISPKVPFQRTCAQQRQIRWFKFKFHLQSSPRAFSHASRFLQLDLWLRGLFLGLREYISVHFAHSRTSSWQNDNLTNDNSFPNIFTLLNIRWTSSCSSEGSGTPFLMLKYTPCELTIPLPGSHPFPFTPLHKEAFSLYPLVFGYIPW